MSLEGKIALVTGATRGIGRAIAKQLADNGAQVFGTATSEKGANSISNDLKTINASNEGLVLDVSNPDSVKTAMDHIKDAGGPVSILINNAGITRDNLMLRMKDEEWDDIINTNLTPIFRLSKICLRGMMKARWGRIVNITSVVGNTGNAGQANYAAAKAGALGFTKSLALEIASRNITVNAVAPGFTDTDMTRELTDDQKDSILNTIPMARLGQPEEVANAVSFLCSPEAGYMTGQTLHVNGGMYMP